MSNIDMVSLLTSVNPVELERDFDSRVVTSIVKPPIVVRLDGAGFGKALRDFNWPRDERVHRALIKAAVELMRAFSGEYSLVISDEINVFLLSYVPFNGREYKLISSMAGLASAMVSNALGRVLYFDARVIPLNDNCRDVARYMLYRVRVGFNNYHIEIAQRSGVVPPESTPHIDEVVRALGGPRLTWESLGTCLARARVELEGIDRRSGERIKYVRKRIIERNPIDVINELSRCGPNVQ
ncbi:tRNA(His) guanylyltransferase Thg1 family protein [Vulcanisaeta sp. JCM 16159]|uniref:tRNA(His) guanylyltransferase Thg1 family protein n=1 Tax=Vulcanisaeta sp. JCM 16159 TaxID=1295371 RepID=UPI0006CF26B7|nr:tRNA(His) guanylyltransferase Thg1 family protein [Vulcanisaeta sp. JCM 16159]